MRLIAIVLFIALGVGALAITISNDAARVSSYETALAKARDYAQRGLAYPSANAYVEALGVYNGDFDVAVEYVEQLKLVDMGMYLSGLKSLIKNFPDKAYSYENLAQYYYDNNGFSKVLEIVNQAAAAGVQSEGLTNFQKSVKYEFRSVASGFTEASSFVSFYSIVKRGGYYGMIDYMGNIYLQPKYDAVSWPSSGYIPISVDGEAYFVNQAGHKVQQTSGKVEWIGTYSGGHCAVRQNGKYGYTDNQLNLPESFDYDYAGAFASGVAAVQKGGKWALIGNDLSMITEFVYDDILLTEFETCISHGVIFAKQNGSYIMLDATGARIGDGSYEKAHPFVSDQPVGVIEKGQVKLIFTDGSTFTSEELDLSGVKDVKAYTNGIAPAFDGEKWGYIDHLGKFVIEPQFDDCRSFDGRGIAAVKRGDVWQYIQLLGYVNG